MVQQGLGRQIGHRAPQGPKVTRTQGTPAAAAVLRSVTVSPTRSDRASVPPLRSTAAR
jgi:hypothetical protein